jgi:dipeptidyl aminopeptidase/acylaminoacyl peptidase
MISINAIRTLGGAVLCAASAVVHSAIPAGHFFGDAEYSGAKLSPSAKHLAIRRSNGQRDGLFVIDLATQSIKPVASFGNVDINHFEWVNDQRLVFDTSDHQRAPGSRDKAPGLFAVNHDGANLRELADRNYGPSSETGSNIKRKTLPYNIYMLDQPGAQDNDAVYVRRPKWNAVTDELEYMDLLRLDTVTGQTTYVPRPSSPHAWLLDRQGQPGATLSRDGASASIELRDPASGAWRKLASFAAYGDAPGAFDPVGFGPDGKLYVVVNGGADKRSLRLYDIAKGEVGKDALVALADYDFEGELVYSKGKLVGIEVLSDARAMVWLDAEMQAAQQEVDLKLPGTVNLLRPAARPETPWLLVTAYSDRQPEVYLLYNSATKKLVTVGVSRPDIKPDEMGQLDLVRYQARDGMTIPAWLTLPKGKDKNLPLVVLVHGGPFVRGGEWQWRDEAQFLASRGYAVLEPEFRGSTGFGSKHYRAGWKQWGLAMQDDVADAALWAVKQGIADGKRVCIAGASYGGYATLMGLARNPELFKCGFEWAGVTDIGLMYTGHWSFESDLSMNWRDHGMPKLVGDPVKDAEQLKATSPLNLAGSIRQPLLMAYGSDDYRVPIYHGRKFHSAVQAGNPQAELVVYTGEGHGWSLVENRIDFWTRVEKFLARHIGGAQP